VRLRCCPSVPARFLIATYARQGSLRRLGQAGSGLCAATPGTTGSTTLDGIFRENAIETVAVPLGAVSPKDQMGWVPFGAAIVTRIREPVR
jgi:hypothetical protein